MAAQNYCYSCAYLLKKIQSVLSNLSAFKVYFWVWTIYGMAPEDYVKMSEIRLFISFNNKAFSAEWRKKGDIGSLRAIKAIGGVLITKKRIKREMFIK